ncbi:hypothetical protein BD289DRAFT_478917 [Coniella lustricola]|uniref:polynucleotide adenylyltransferase n=1 Tax=Coniella lustricola TaxID=2025994 RepID=A0A2T3AKQ4_9PEZI|nr:hypothetical protein BD289DRAFT_478917 [Coniella lustricola]
MANQDRLPVPAPPPSPSDLHSSIPQLSTTSYDTALAILPPRSLWPRINRLRALYDKAYIKWPSPHINLVYPFVQPDALPRAVEAIQTTILTQGHQQSSEEVEQETPLRISLGTADVFTHRHHNTIFLHDENDERTKWMSDLRLAILSSALGQGKKNDTAKAGYYRFHMTIGQSDDVNAPWHHSLLEKARLLPRIEWDVEDLHVLVRERTVKAGEGSTSSESSEMKMWAMISLKDGSIRQQTPPQSFSNASLSFSTSTTEPGLPYVYFQADDKWRPATTSSFVSPDTSQPTPPLFAIATYNVLAEFQHPPSSKRYPLLIQNILSTPAKADVLVLQEVTDHFLSFVLREEGIRRVFPWCSHGPPDQHDVDPLPSHNNIVVLSKHAFEWESVPLAREHKSSLVATFKHVGRWSHEARANDNEDIQSHVFKPLVLAAVHLTHGLKDGSITAKKSELDRTLAHLAQEKFAGHPVVLAGDFNMPTSSYTITQALDKNAVSAHAIKQLRALDATLLLGGDSSDSSRSHGFSDAWTISRLERGVAMDEDVDVAFEGEQGATYDPTTNALAAEITGGGSGMRPQRIDRILIRDPAGVDAEEREFLKVVHFNKFGKITEADPEDASKTMYASDHWGVRAVLKLDPETDYSLPKPSRAVASVELKTAQGSLADSTGLLGALQKVGSIPSAEDMETRASAFQLLKEVILDTNSSSTATNQSEQQSQSSTTQLLVFVPVGSYALGVWTPSSDMDCLCIGPFSTPTFFSLATKRLRRAATRGLDIQILRKVTAYTGVMLELQVHGIKVDLQYAPAHTIAELWPTAMLSKLPASHAVWNLPSHTLAKLKAVRDCDYVRRSVPDLATFAAAHRAVKTWAKRRGIYTAKYGYLGGIQITVLLARVYKLLARDVKGQLLMLSVADVLLTFFNHYAGFDWKHDLVIDPLFHKDLKYRRSDREPLVILGYYPPALNTCLAASAPSVRTIAEEFRRADSLLSSAHSTSTTWSEFLGEANDGTAEFLQRYKSYIKIDVQFWGGSLTKGRGFVGWVECRCVSLLVDLNKRAPMLHARFWPARWMDQEITHDDKTTEVQQQQADDSSHGSRDYQGCYLIGLDKLDSKVTTSSTEDKLMLGTLISTLGRFEEQIRRDERHFDAQYSWMSASVVKAAEVASLVVDNREWGQYALGDEESDEEDEEGEEEGQDLDQDHAGGEYNEQRYSRSSSKKDKPATNQPRSVVVPKPAGAGKFRTAADVLNRLRWDPSLDSADYVVGYEDRFVGAMEKGLDTWKLEQTHEEFIPQHRILYFKRKSEEIVVWERRTRKDLLFGSG